MEPGLLRAVLSITAYVIVTGIALAGRSGKRIDAATARVDDMNVRNNGLRSEMVRGFEKLDKRIEDLRTDLVKGADFMEADIRELRARS